MGRTKPIHSAPNRTYHGLSEMDEAGGSRILVEEYGGGPTQRESAEVLYELISPNQYYGPHAFWWGYTGTSAMDAAATLLEDALGQAQVADMRREFMVDVVAHLGDEFHLNRMAVVRWARGWCAEHGVEFIADGEAR